MLGQAVCENTSAQMLELLAETGTNLAVHLDTCHMDIEDDEGRHPPRDEHQGAGLVTASFLGIDLGTSGLKLTLVAEDGLVLAESEASYDVQRRSRASRRPTRTSGWRPSGARRPARLHAGHGLQAIGVTGQMHGLVLAREDGRPTRPAVLWPDQRAASVLPSWLELPGETRARLANPVFAGMAGPMLTWLRQNEPADLDAAALVRSPKDWLRAQLTGDRVTERSDASATLLWDVTTDDWSTAATAAAGVRGDQLPEVVAATRWSGRRPGRRSTTCRCRSTRRCPWSPGEPTRPARSGAAGERSRRERRRHRRGERRNRACRSSVPASPRPPGTPR